MKTDITSDLEFFVLLAPPLASLSAAARALDLTPPAATRRLAQMEEKLSVRLVNRTTRTVSLTAEGEIYLQHATRILSQVQAMEDAVSSSGAAPRGLLRVNASLGFGRTTIAPLVVEVRERVPGRGSAVRGHRQAIDLIEHGFDLAIRFGELPDQRLNARRIMSNRRFLCASPVYLDAHGTPEKVADLAQHRCIVHRQNDDAYGIWRFVREHHSEAREGPRDAVEQ